MDIKYINMDSSGRIIIPATLRKELGVEDGGEFLLYVKDDEIRLIDKKRSIEKKMEALEKIREKAQKLKKPGEKIVDDFLRNRKNYSGDI